MNAFLSVLEQYDINYKDTFKRGELTTLQVNMGNLCNQNCRHCHVDASPGGKNTMPGSVADDIVKFLSRNKLKTLDITGGAPELNAHFDYLILNARPFVEELIVRSNLTVFFESGKGYLPEFFRKYKIRLVCSLPCYTEKNVDNQRGEGVFRKSIEAIKALNALGYAQNHDLRLDLVYNPMGAYLPPGQEALEKDYRLNLKKNYGLDFDRLIAITNVPLKRFKRQLDSCGEYGKYLELLKENFNPEAVENIMCKNFLSVGFDGNLYDCDFNQALGWAIKDEAGKHLTIGELTPEILKGREIMAGEHCLSCTAGFGSSCQGALTAIENRIRPRAAMPPDSRNSVNPALSTVKNYDELVKGGVKEYYGKILKTKKDLKTSACCSADSLPENLRRIVQKIDSEITDKFYGCGAVIPPLLEGCRVLDLGCGTGRDCFIVSYLAGEGGFVIGVDMTDEQLKIARKHIDGQMKKFGFLEKNLEFKKGYIEELKEIGIRDNSIDVVISNCVINLSPDKESVFREIFRVLKPGGELYFSDVFSSRRIPEDLKSDEVLYGECLGGALYIEDFRRLLEKLGCPDYRLVNKNKIILSDPRMKEKTQGLDFYSMTIRAFKLADLEDRCEDYGQIAVYRGTIPGHPDQFILDDHHIFLKAKPMPVCGNTAAMLEKTRYAKHFKLIGDRATHYGQFCCSAKDKEEKSTGGACC